MKRSRKIAPAPSPPARTASTTAVLQTQSWSGPIPPPAALEALERIVPGSAERLIAQAEAEGEHRRKLEDRESRWMVRDAHVGQALAALFALSSLGVAALAISLKQEWAGVVLAGLAVGPVVYAFLRETWNGK